MITISYFSFLSFFIAIVLIISRYFIISIGSQWEKDKLKEVYDEKKPPWVFRVLLLGGILVLFTWFEVFKLDINYSWIVSSLFTIIYLRVLQLLINYEKFIKFVSNNLKRKSKLNLLSLQIYSISLIFILLGIFLY